MKTRIFSNHAPLTTDADTRWIKNDTYLVGPTSNGKYFMFDYFISPYNDNEQNVSRTFLCSGTPKETIEWVETNRPELINEVGNILNLSVKETII